MNGERRNGSDDVTERPHSAAVGRRRAEARSSDGAGGATGIDLVAAYCAVALSLVAIPLVVGVAVVGAGPPSPGSTVFYGLAALVMVPGLLMGATALWLCARSDPA